MLSTLLLLAAASMLAATVPSTHAGPCRGTAWREAWAAAPSDAQPTYSDQSLRLVLTPRRSGDVARVRLSNRFGTRPIAFGSVFIGQQRSGADLIPGSNERVRFKGRRRVTIPAGQETLSDPVPISFRAFQHVAVSVYVAAPGGPATEHFLAEETSFVSASGSGDLTADEAATGYSTTTPARPFVTGLETRAPRTDGVVVAVGDSITDGAGSAVDEDTRYPDFLARRLEHRPGGVSFSVLNEGIGGNRILRGGLTPIFGPSLLRRLHADVVTRPGITTVIVLEGINDLGQPPPASARDVIGGLRRVVHRLERRRGGGRRHLDVLVGTLTPSRRAGGAYGTAETNAKRHEINRFIRRSGIGDGYVDFARAVRDPVHQGRLAARYDSGDHLHPNAAGYRRMARTVTLSALRGPRCG